MRSVNSKGLGPWSPELLISVSIHHVVIEINGFVQIDDIQAERRLELEAQKNVLDRNAEQLEYFLFYCCKRAKALLSNNGE